MKNKKMKNGLIGLFSIIILLILLSPAINSEIYAKSKEVPVKIQAGSNDEMPDFYKRVMEYYKILDNLEIYKANAAFDKSKITDTPDSKENPNTEKPNFISLNNDLANEGSIYVPKGYELFQNQGGNFSSGGMLRRPEITCLGHGIMLTGENGQRGYLDENGRMDPELARLVDEALVSGNEDLAEHGSRDYQRLFSEMVYKEVSRKNHPNIHWTMSGNSVSGEIYGVDPVEERAKYNALKMQITSDLSDANEKASRAITEVIRRYSLGLDTLQRTHREDHQHGSTPTDNLVRGVNKYTVRERREGARLERNPDPMGPSSTISPEAGYIINEIYTKKPEETEYNEQQLERSEHTGGGDVQYAIWTTTEEGQRGEAWYGGTPLQADGTRAASIIAGAKEFKKYWEKMVDFCNDRKENNYPNQQVIHSTQRDKKIKFKGEVPSILPKEKIIKNPGLKYEPRFVEVDGNKPEDKKQMIFNQEKQLFKVGPYKLDYVDYQMDKDGKRAWLAALTNAKIYGKYANGENGQDGRFENSELYNRFKEEEKAYLDAKKENNAAKKEFSDNINALRDTMVELSNKLQSKSPEAINEYKEFKKIYDKIAAKYNELIKEEKQDKINEKINEIRELYQEFNNLKASGLPNIPEKELLNKTLEKFENTFKAIDKLSKTYLKEKTLKEKYKQTEKEWEKERKKLVKEENKNQREIDKERDNQKGNVNRKDYQNSDEHKVKTSDLGDFKIKFHKNRSTDKNNKVNETNWRSIAVSRESGLKKGDLVYIEKFKDINRETFVVTSDDGNNPNLSGKEISIAVNDTNGQNEQVSNVKKIEKKDPNVASVDVNTKNAKDVKHAAKSKSDEEIKKLYYKIYNEKKEKIDKEYRENLKKTKLFEVGKRLSLFREMSEKTNRANIEALKEAKRIYNANNSSLAERAKVTHTEEKGSNNKNSQKIESLIKKSEQLLSNTPLKDQDLRMLRNEIAPYASQNKDLKKYLDFINKRLNSRNAGNSNNKSNNKNSSGGNSAGNNSGSSSGNVSGGNANGTTGSSSGAGNVGESNPGAFEGTNTGNVGGSNAGSSSGETTETQERPDIDEIDPDNDAELNITDPEIKGWKFHIKGVKPEDREHYVPLPGEEFYFIIPYDQNLRGLSAIKLEFHHMVYGGEALLYEGRNKVFGEINDDSRVDTQITDGGMTLNVSNVVYSMRANNSREGVSQPLGYWASAKWFEKTILVLKANDEPDYIPRNGDDVEINPGEVPTPEPSLSRFLVPIGGRVWEDKVTGNKHLGRDNVYKEDEDELLKGVKVQVYRVIGEKDGELGVKNILEKQRARLYKENSSDEIDWNEVYTNEQGQWGPYDIHDVGFSENEKEKYSPDKYRVTFEVEYLYDGIEYEPVIPIASIEGDDIVSKVDSYTKMTTESRKEHFISSFAVENKEERIKYNIKNAEIAGLDQINDEGMTKGVTNEIDENNQRTGKTTEIEYKKDEESEISGRTISKYQKAMPEDHKEKVAEGRFMSASTLNIGLPYMFEKDYSNEEDTTAPAIENPEQEKIIKTAKPYMTNVNFGLTVRKKAKSSLTKDLVSAKVIVNRKALNYLFDDAYDQLLSGIPEGTEPEEFYNRLFTIQTENDPINNNLQYKLDIYKTDYIFRTEIYKNDEEGNSEDPNGIYEAIHKDIVQERTLDNETMEAYTEDTRKLDVFLTYRISIFNDTSKSTNYDMYYTQINDYYHEDLVPVLDQDIEKVVEIDPQNGNNNHTEDIGPAPTDTATAAEKGKTIKILTPKYKIYDKANAEVEKEANGMVDFSKDFKDFKWEKLNDEKSGYHMLESTDDAPELIVPSGGRADIYTNYRIKRDGSDERVGLNNSLKLGKFYNVAEIAGFAAYDKFTGLAEGVVDDFSAPNNINFEKTLETEQPLLDKSSLEADTDGAPIINVDISDEEPKRRKLSGLVWEDFRNFENAGIRTGNGIKEDSEKPIPNQKVILEERVSIKKDLYDKEKIVNEDKTEIKIKPDDTAEYIDIPFVWPNEIKTSDGNINLNGLTGLNSIQKTNENGIYEFIGIPAGNFVVKTRYSSGKDIEDLVKTVKTELDTENRLPNYYNGIDFKSTLFYGGDKEKVNTTWLGKIIDGEKAKYSYLRDDEFRRLEITKLFKKWGTTESELLAIFDKDLSNPTGTQKEILKKAHEYSHMVAVTPKINFSIEFYEKYAGRGEEIPNLLNLHDKAFSIKGVNYTGETPNEEVEKYEVDNLNLSIVERPQTKLVLNKEIETIEFITNNGNKNFSADFKTELDVTRKDQNYNKYIQQPATAKFKTVVDTESQDNSRLEETLSFQNTIYGIDGIIPEDERQYAQKFAYLNIDETLLQGGVVNVNYKISVYNLSEVDRKINLEAAEDDTLRGKQYYTGKESPEASALGMLRHEYIENEDYRFGRYVGDEYYAKVDKNLEKDDIASAKIEGLLDIMSTTMEQNQKHEKANEWMQMSKNALIGVLQGVTKENAESQEYLDKRNNRNVPYITENKSNILGRFEENEKEVKPIDLYLKEGEKQNIVVSKTNKAIAPEWMRIVEVGSTGTTATIGTAGDFFYENSAEIVMYEMDTARRAVGSAPGSIFNDLELKDETIFLSTAKQYDADTAEYITVTPPTGQSNAQKKNNQILIIYITIFTAIIGITGVSIKTMLYKKDKKEMYFANNPWERK